MTLLQFYAYYAFTSNCTLIWFIPNSQEDQATLVFLPILKSYSVEPIISGQLRLVRK